MKKQAYTMIAMVVLVGSMAVAAKAQTSGRARSIANIPFEFNVGDKTLPAGEYIVRQVNPSSDRAVLQLRSKDGKSSAMVQTNSVIDRAKSNEMASLIFNRYGNLYFFAEAWMPGNDGFAAAKSATEKSAGKELAGIKSQTETVALKHR